MLIKPKRQILLLILSFIINGCIVEYFPKINVDDELLVVDGLITDQARTNIIKLSRTLPLWRYRGYSFPKPLSGCKVWISDNLGHIDSLCEAKTGSYITDSVTFRGVPGRVYTLHIRTSDSEYLNYESFPMVMKPVPPIDSIYYEKKVSVIQPMPVEGCQIYLNTHDPTNNCKFFRWEYSETWEFHLPFWVPNRVCWLSGKSNGIFIKNASMLAEARISRYLLYSIKDPIDRLSVKYSLLVNQFSLDEDEYLYWERFKSIVDQVGGLYDKIPSTIPNNLFCVEYPLKKVLGYFSVSAVSSKRIFIKDSFAAGFDYRYLDCITDSVRGTDPIPGLGFGVWVIIDNSYMNPPMRYLTKERRCADCTVRGTNVKPVFWDDDK
jgi:hypothetical protein